MKKSLSLLVASSMVLSMFASAAYAAEAKAPTQDEKFAALKELGIFDGFPDGTSGLEKNMTRAQFAKVLTIGTGLEENAAASTYSDVSATHWAKGYIGAVTEAQLMQGVGNNKFNPNGNVTIQELAKTLVLSLGLEPVEGATVEGASAWAVGYVQAALDAKIIPSATNYNVPATRGQLVDAIYNVVAGDQEEAVTVKSAVAVDENNITVEFSDGKSVSQKLDTALVEGQATKVTVEYNGVKYEVEVTLPAQSLTASIKSHNSFELKFARTVDSAKAKVTVTKNGNDVKVDNVAFAKDGLSAIATLDNNLFLGDYVITVDPDGNAETKNSLTQTVKAENEKVAKIEFNSDKLAITSPTVFDEAVVSYKVLNQYGDDITKSATGIQWTSSKGSISADPLKGKLTLSVNNPLTFVSNEVVVITGVHQASSTVVTSQLTVSTKSMVDSIEVKGLYNVGGGTLNTASNYSTYYLLVSAKDQYGNIVDAAQFNSDVVVVPSNPAIFSFNPVQYAGGVLVSGPAEDGQGPNGDQIGLQLVKNPSIVLDGTNKISFISKLNTQAVTYDVTVAKASTLDSFTLDQPATAIASAEKVNLPFTALDQNGNKLTKYDDINGKVTISGATLKKNTATGAAYLEFQAVTNNSTVSIPQTVFATTLVSGKTSQLTVDVQPAAYPVSVSVSNSLPVNYLAGGSNSIDHSNFIVKDQYGRSMNDSGLFNNYKIVVTSGNGKFNNLTFTGTGQWLGFAANAAATVGSDQLTVEVQTAAGASLTNPVKKNFSAYIIEKKSIKEYAVDDIGKVNNGGDANHNQYGTQQGTPADPTATPPVAAVPASDAYQKSLNVYGKLTDGTKVIIPTSLWTLIAYGDLQAVNQKVDAKAVNTGDASEVKRNIDVIIDAYDGQTTISKEVTVSDSKPHAASVAWTGATGFTFDGSNVTVNAADFTIENLVRAIHFNDQYGVELKAFDYTADDAIAYTFTNVVGATVTNNGTAGATITVASGNSFQVTLTFVSGLKVTYNVGIN